MTKPEGGVRAYEENVQVKTESRSGSILINCSDDQFVALVDWAVRPSLLRPVVKSPILMPK